MVHEHQDEKGVTMKQVCLHFERRLKLLLASSAVAYESLRLEHQLELLLASSAAECVCLHLAR